MSRINRTMRNVRYGFFGQVLALIVSFVARNLFIRYLGVEYLGVHGLFSSLLLVLSMAEAGISSAIVYSMYQPLAHREHAKVRSLMEFYRRAYIYVGSAIAALGLLITPFLTFLSEDLSDIPGMHGLFLLFVTNSAVTYFLSHKKALLFADQKRHIVIVYRYAAFIALSVTQVGVLMLTANFGLFLGVQILFTIVENVALSRKVDRIYPFLNDQEPVSLEGGEREGILKNVRALIFHRLGGAVLVGTDNVLISFFVGLVAVGLYSNYLLVVNSVGLVLASVFASVTASVGNLGVLASSEHQLQTFRAVDLASVCLHGVSAASLFVMLNPFMALWLGPEFVLEWQVVLLIVANFYLTGVRRSLWVFKEAKGVFWPDRFRPLVEVLVNLGGSMLLGHFFGLLGVLMGTLLSALLVCLPWEPRIVFRYALHLGAAEYYGRFAYGASVTMIAVFVSYSGGQLIAADDWLSFGCLGALSVLSSTLVFLIFYARSAALRKLARVAGIDARFYRRPLGSDSG